MKYKAEFCDIARDSLKEGISKNALAAKFGVSIQTLFNWQKKQPEFKEAVEEGLAFSEKWWEDRGRDACSGDNFNAAVWIFTMKNRFGWKDRQDVTSDDEPLQINIVRYGKENAN